MSSESGDIISINNQVPQPQEPKSTLKLTKGRDSGDVGDIF
jgi:hypothetical protein